MPRWFAHCYYACAIGGAFATSLLFAATLLWEISITLPTAYKVGPLQRLVFTRGLIQLSSLGPGDFVVVPGYLYGRVLTIAPASDLPGLELFPKIRSRYDISVPLWPCAAALIALAVVASRHRVRKRSLDDTCMACGYRLHGLDSPRCPECGTINKVRPP